MTKLMAIVLSVALALVSVLGSTGDALVYAQDSVKNNTDVLIFHTTICAEAPQIV